ncbi:hypothetical protein EBZ02_05360 [bacterium]|nr:hypothetical protein [bacterium]
MNAPLRNLRPAVLSLLAEQIPVALREVPRWVAWRYEKRTKPGGEPKWAKMPLTSRDTAAKVCDPTTWGTFQELDSAYLLYDFDGIGLVLTGGDGLHGIDIDDCRNPVTGQLNSLACRILERIRGYAEISPSGTGIKIVARTNLDKSRVNHKTGLELYVGSRTSFGGALSLGFDPKLSTSSCKALSRLKLETCGPAPELTWVKSR